MKIATFLFALLLGVTASAQVVFMNRDANGSLILSDKPPPQDVQASGKDQPAQSPARAKVKSYVARPVVKLAPQGPSQSAPALQQNVVLYAADWCPHCRRARQYLRNHGIRYTDINVDTDEGGRAFEQMGRGGIPLLVTGGQQLRGFSERAYDAVFKSR